MSEYVKCISCRLRYVTDKARENFAAEGLEGEALLCLQCIGQRTGKVMNRYGYLVKPEDVDNGTQRQQSISETISTCRPCMKKKGRR